MNRLFVSNSPKWRLIRTIIQGVIGVIIANLDLIVGTFHIPAEFKPFIVALTMAVLSPIMKAMGTYEMPEKEDLPHDYWESGEDK